MVMLLSSLPVSFTVADTRAAGFIIAVEAVVAGGDAIGAAIVCVKNFVAVDCVGNDDDRSDVVAAATGDLNASMLLELIIISSYPTAPAAISSAAISSNISSS